MSYKKNAENMSNIKTMTFSDDYFQSWTLYMRVVEVEDGEARIVSNDYYNTQLKVHLHDYCVPYLETGDIVITYPSQLGIIIMEKFRSSDLEARLGCSTEVRIVSREAKVDPDKQIFLDKSFCNIMVVTEVADGLACAVDYKVKDKNGYRNTKFDNIEHDSSVPDLVVGDEVIVGNVVTDVDNYRSIYIKGKLRSAIEKPLPKPVQSENNTRDGDTGADVFGFTVNGEQVEIADDGLVHLDSSFITISDKLDFRINGQKIIQDHDDLDD